MKQYLLLLAFGLTLFSCKKDKSSDPPKDYTTLLSNSIWTGYLNYTGKATEAYSILFKAGGLMEWRELRDSTTGTWKSENGIITVALKSGAGFTTGIKNDNSFSDIKNLPVNGFSVTSGALDKFSDVVIEGTVWKGTNVTVTFKPKYFCDVELGATGAVVKYSNLYYYRVADCVRFNASAGGKWFMIFSSDAVLKGANLIAPDPEVHEVVLSKQ